MKITIRKKARHAEPEVRIQLEKVMKRIACNQPKVAAARAQVEHWMTDKAKDAAEFVANAKEEVVEAERQKLLEHQAAQEKLQAALSRVRAAD